jgi:hypothetical protein
MIKKLLTIILTVILLANLCNAQPTNSQSITNWGESVNGVQLSVSLSTNILNVGSSSSVLYRVKNSSTNVIGWGVVNVYHGFDVFLTNSSGKVYFLTPQRNTNATIISVSYSYYYRMGIGETYEYAVPINIDKEIEPGSYQLEAKQHFSIFKKRPMQIFELVSNPLEVQVK